MARKDAPAYVAEESIEQYLKGKPPRRVGGKPNPAYWQKQLAEHAVALSAAAHAGEVESARAHDLAIRALLTEAEANGFDPAKIREQRTDAQLVADAVGLLVENSEALFEMADETLDALEKAMDDADSKCVRKMNEYVRAEDRLLPKLKALFQRVRTLQNRARNDWNKNYKLGIDEKDCPRDVVQPGVRAAHLLRYMVWVGRSNIDQRVFLIGDHLAKAACDIFIAQEWCRVDRDGVYPGKGPHYQGAIISLPVGHGKTELAQHWSAREICRNPATQGTYLHAVEGLAELSLKYIGNLFTPEYAPGRRNLALFPGLAVEKATNTFIRMKLDTPVKNATLTAYGVMTSRLGANLMFGVFDDIVPQEDRDQDQERERRKRKIAGTWVTRRRGKKTFTLTIGPRYHPEDVVAEMIRTATKVPYLVSIQRTGGPRTSPKFYPLWPEMYPASRLESMFNEMGRDESLWAASFEMNPESQNRKLVRTVRLYDSTSAEHAAFMERATRYISLDPSATNRAHSDKSGLIYAAKGDVVVEVGGVHQYETRLRILSCEQFHATAPETAAAVVAFSERLPVDYAVVETGGANATASILEEHYGIDVVQCPVGLQNKEVRLRRASGAIDDTQEGGNTVRAVVEFPGEWEDGELVPCEMAKPLIRQLLDFGNTKEDHLCDALTQLVNHLMPELKPGVGVLSRKILVSENSTDERRAILRKRNARIIHGKRENKNPFEAEVDWLKGHTWRN